MSIGYHPSVFFLQSHPASSLPSIFRVHLRLLFLFSSPSAFPIQLTSLQPSSTIIILAFSILLYPVFSICSISCFRSCHPSPFVTPSPWLYRLDFPLYRPRQGLFVDFSDCLSALGPLGCDHVSNAHGGCPVYPIFAMFSQVYRVPIPSRFSSSIFPGQAPIPILTLSCLSTFPSFHLLLLSMLPLFSLWSSLISLSPSYHHCLAASVIPSASILRFPVTSILSLRLPSICLTMFPLFRYLSASSDIRVRFAPASVSVIYCFLFYRYPYCCCLGLWI